MKKAKDYGAIERRILQNIQFTARQLARVNAVPGMDVEDYEQDLLADLIHRTRAFNPNRSSYPTFADRVVRHRASSLKAETMSRLAERHTVSLDATFVDAEGNELSLHDWLPDERSLTEDDLALRIDLRRACSHLAPMDWQGFELLLGGNVAEGARRAGINRSTAYDRINRFRARVADCGLAAYAPDSSSPPAVNGNPEIGLAAGEGFLLINTKALSPRLFVTGKLVHSWMDRAIAGDVLEYYRGFLVLDRLKDAKRLPERTRRELICVAQEVAVAAARGTVHLVQRKYGNLDYGYLIVVRRPQRSTLGDM